MTRHLNGCVENVNDGQRDEEDVLGIILGSFSDENGDAEDDAFLKQLIYILPSKIVTV